MEETYKRLMGKKEIIKDDGDYAIFKEIWKEAQKEKIKEINEAISKCENDNEELSAIARILNREV